MDDGYVGGATRNGKRGRGTDKERIVVALSKTENGAALFTRMHVVEDVTGGTLQQVVDETIAPDSKIECDGYKSYRNLSGVALDAKSTKPAIRSSCARQEPSLHLVSNCIKPISILNIIFPSVRNMKSRKSTENPLKNIRIFHAFKLIHA